MGNGRHVSHFHYLLLACTLCSTKGAGQCPAACTEPHVIPLPALANLCRYTYEREHIEQWIRHKGTSPMTNLQLKHTEVTENRVLRSAIRDWQEKHP